MASDGTVHFRRKALDALRKRGDLVRTGLVDITRRAPLVLALPEALEMQKLGRTLLHTALVGIAAGVVGAAFFASLEAVQDLLLVPLTGYVPLKARGETLFAAHEHHRYRPWLLALFPAI